MYNSSMQSFLSQDRLVKDYLKAYMDLAKQTTTPLGKNAFVWCVEQIGALNTMNYDDWLVLLYEDLCLNPSGEVEKVLNYLHAKYDKARIARFRFSEPSDTVRPDSAILKQRSPIGAWKEEMGKKDIDQVLNIVRRFSLDRIYDENPRHHQEYLDRVLKHQTEPW